MREQEEQEGEPTPMYCLTSSTKIIAHFLVMHTANFLLECLHKQVSVFALFKSLFFLCITRTVYQSNTTNEYTAKQTFVFS